MKLFYTRFLVILLASCTVVSKNYNPNKKYSREALQQDYGLLRRILEKEHPSLYWYTPRDSMDYFFDAGYRAIADSMTELQFGWKILAPLTAAIHCGHTSFSMSPSWNRFVKNKAIPSFPLYLKVWKDTMVVIYNLNQADTLLKKGTIITAINGISSSDIIRIMLDYMVQDGYAANVNYLRLSESFPYFHRNIFGLYKFYRVGYLDSSGVAKDTVLPYFEPPVDSLKKFKKLPHPDKNIQKLPRREEVRTLKIDSSYALMTINSFSKGHLKHFFKKSFRRLHRHQVSNLVIDIRTNGGGDISNYVLLARFLRNTPFKVSDSAWSQAKNFRPYTKYITAGFFDNLGLFFLTHKEKDGKYHFGYWERHEFMPKGIHHFQGATYILTNGLTFSASTLFCNTVKGQPGITLVGEETGGGWYGNSGIMIPDIKLPNTGLRVRLPFFRIVQYHHISQKGTGVLPDVYLPPLYRDIVSGTDTKLAWVLQKIKQGGRPTATE